MRNLELKDNWEVKAFQVERAQQFSYNFLCRAIGLRCCPELLHKIQKLSPSTTIDLLGSLFCLLSFLNHSKVVVMAFFFFERIEVSWRREKATKRFNYTFYFEFYSETVFSSVCVRRVIGPLWLVVFFWPEIPKLASELTFTRNTVHHSPSNCSVFFRLSQNYSSVFAVFDMKRKHAMPLIF